MEWISVKDGLPAESQIVLTYRGEGEPPDELQPHGLEEFMWHLNTKRWQYDDWYEKNDPPPVTHWMPLPDPPKEKA